MADRLRENVRLRRATLGGSRMEVGAESVIESRVIVLPAAATPIGPWSDRLRRLAGTFSCLKT